MAGIENLNTNQVDYHDFCIVLADGTLVYKFVPECEGCAEVYYTDALGVKITEPNLTDSKPCKDTTIECRESQEWTYGIDNTGTRFNDVADYVITLSDGSTLNFSQDGSSTSWTPQLQEWATNIQAAADAAGLAWFVEPRAVDTANPENIDGTYNGPNGTPFGLPGAPSVPVAIALDAGGMAWRYVNIQICPGQPVPVSAERISSRDFTNNPYQLTTAGAVLGPINKFKVCVECGIEDDLWYIFDKDLGEYREANAGEIPNCWEPCGTLALADAPPDRDCEFFIDLACDDNGDNGNQAGYTNQITRRATVCNGEQIALEYFTEDPTDPSALVEYTLVGDFVDCTSGEIISLPLIDGILVKCNEDPISESYESDVRVIGSKHPLPVFITEECSDKIEIDYEYICNENTNVYDLHLITSTNGVAAPTIITPTTTPCDEDPDFEERTVCDATTETIHTLLLEISEDGSYNTIEDIDLLTPCVPKQTECVESQEWTYALDNTGTTTNEDAVVTITLSDGSSFDIQQTNQGAVSQWTPQMAEWGANIQTAANDSGLAWFVETRYIAGPGSLAGGGGFSGPPSQSISNALWAGGIRARYVNIQICPGQPVPVSAVYNSATRTDYSLTTAGAVLGPIQKFFVCRSCGVSPVWYLEDGVTLASSGQIPNCWEPCGTLSLTDSPPDRDCEFQYDQGCDNLNQTDVNNFVTITRRSTICVGEDIVVDYFIEDPTDSSALIDYIIIGQFVDCATGEVIELPPVNGVVIDCDNSIQAESYDQDVRIVGSKNPIPVFQVAQCGDYIRTEDVKLCEVDARFLLLIDSTGVFARYSFITGVWETVPTLSVASAGGSADVENFRLYNFVAPDQLTTVDVNTDTQLPNITVVDGTNINPSVTTNPKTFSAASFRDTNGLLYAQDTAGADAGLYTVDPITGEVNFVTTLTGISGTGTSIAIDNTTDTLYVNGSTLSYEVDWVTGVGVQVANPPIQPNGSTFDTDGNWYVTQSNNTYYLPAGADGNVTSNWIQIIDDFTAGANSIAYYEVVAQQPSCFFRRYGILENGDREVIGDFNVTDDSPRTVVGEVDCCGCGKDESSGASSINNFPSIQDLEKVEICDGEKTLWQVNTTDSNGVINVTYENETGVISEPASWTVGKCDCQLFDYFEIEDDGITNTLRNREWHGTEPAHSSTATADTSVGRGFRERHDFSLPTTTDNSQNNLQLNDTNNTAVELDIQVKEGYIIVSEPMDLRYSDSSEGYWAVELGECCGELSLIAENGGFFAGREMKFSIPTGIHKIRLWNIDSAGSNSSATLSYSLDGGITYINDNTPPNIILSETKPKQSCKQGYLCGNQYFELDKTTPIVFSDTLRLCKLECLSGANNSSDSTGNSCVENDLTLSVQSGTGNIPAGFKSVTINNISGITTINGGFELGNNRRVDSISFGTDRGNCTNELLPAYTLNGGTWQWIGHR